MIKYARNINDRQIAADKLSSLIQSAYAVDFGADGNFNIQNVAAEYYQPSSIANQMDDSDYLSMRERVLAIAASCQGQTNFEASKASTAKEKTDFDRKVTLMATDVFPLSVYEAAQEGVWSYITLFVAPDVANWRYPNAEQLSDYDRHLGGYRNVFRALWMRGHFTNHDEQLIKGLTEDIAVAIFERTKLASNPKVAIACLKATYESRKRSTNNKIYRDALKRVTRMMSLKSLDLLSPSDLQKVIDELFDESFKIFSKLK